MRIRVMTLMIAAAVVALVVAGALEGTRLSRLSTMYRLTAKSAGVLETVYSRSSRNIDSRIKDNKPITPNELKQLQVPRDRSPTGLIALVAGLTDNLFVDEQDVLASQLIAARERAVRKAEYYGSRRRKYESAARYPWRSIEPDAPEPSF